MDGKGRSIAACIGLGLTMLVGLGCSRNQLAERTALAEAGVLNEQKSWHSSQYGRVFRYYPDQQVYYSAYQDMYFWQDGSKWTSGTTLPQTIKLNHKNMVVVELYTDEPDDFHEEVALAHPGSRAGAGASPTIATVTNQ